MTPPKMPLFSVIIPVYNGEKYLPAAIRSVFDLGYERMEVIIVDDGSTDRTVKVIAGLTDRVSYVSQANRGPAAARNRGLQLARGDVIGFLDADDLWTANMITGALASLIARPQADIVQGHVQEITGSASDNVGTDYAHCSKPYPYINIGSAVYRKNVFVKVGVFDETLRFCEDYDWFLRAFDARVSKIRITDVTLLYRIHPDGLTYGKSLNEIGMTKVHKKVIERRRRGSITDIKPPVDFPSLAEYIGSRAQLIPADVSSA